MVHYSRRSFISRAAGLGATGLGGIALLGAKPANAAAPIAIEIDTRMIEVKGKAAKVFGLVQPSGAHGLVMNAGERFRVRLTNQAGEAALIHWHGLTPPNAQDGVPGVTQPALRVGESYEYDFAVDLPGTNWMHSHHTLQEQALMAAPLIVRDPKDAALDEQEVVVMLHDFTFRASDEILAALSKGMSHDHSKMSEGDMASMDMSGMNMGGADLNDVIYDAFLANDRTLDDPFIAQVEKGARVRLRIINGAAATNFLIDLGSLNASLSDVDGRPIVPVAGNQFPIAMAQRVDLRISLPSQEGAWPILFQREGDVARTGIILATKSGAVTKVGDAAHHPLGALATPLYQALEPLTIRAADRTLLVDLTGSMMDYRWGIGEPGASGAQAGGHHGHLMVSEGERVEMILTNRTAMSHPMHLHGHHFQVVAVNGKRVQGAMRDTELVPIGGSVTIAFNADNPGKWMFHCHNLYHMLSGMMTQLRYL